MSEVSFVELVGIAFVAQLLVLPGEKVQFIIAGLATRYDPLVVVAAAGSAFAGWTIVEIYVGELLQRVLPGFWLSVFTGTLFLVFAILLWRSAPPKASDADVREDDGLANPAADDDTDAVEPDGGAPRNDDHLPDDLGDVTVLGVEIPDRYGAFLPIFAMMAAGEFGDKTQLVTIGLAADYGARAGIWVGEMLAIIPISIVNAYFFHTFSHRFDARKAHLAGALVFGFFALDTALTLGFGFSMWETIVDALATLVQTIGITLVP